MPPIFGKAMAKIGFSIDLMKLKEGTQVYTFNLDDAFFKRFGNEQVTKARIEASAELVKMVSTFSCHLHQEGTLHQLCDRCLSDIEIAVKSDLDLTLRLTDGNEVVYDDDNEIISIPRSIGQADLSQHFYDMVILSLPIKKVCENSLNRKACDEEMLKKLEPEAPEASEPDPRWDQLKKLLGDEE